MFIRVAMLHKHIYSSLWLFFSWNKIFLFFILFQNKKMQHIYRKRKTKNLIIFLRNFFKESAEYNKEIALIFRKNFSLFYLKI